jgi:hypothetical protein
LLSLVVLALYLWRDRDLFHNHYQAMSDAKDKAMEEQDKRLKDLLQRDSADVERANKAEEALKEAQRLGTFAVEKEGEVSKALQQTSEELADRKHAMQVVVPAAPPSKPKKP